MASYSASLPMPECRGTRTDQASAQSRTGGDDVGLWREPRVRGYLGRGSNSGWIFRLAVFAHAGHLAGVPGDRVAGLPSAGRGVIRC